MNKIEEIKTKLQDEFYKSEAQDTFIFTAGWNAAMDLQLPVKFLKWITESRIVYSATNELYLATIGKVTENQLYDFWLGNIYTPNQ